MNGKVFLMFVVLGFVAFAAAEEPCVCTTIYAPVCGEDGKTYGNACVAACNGVKVAYETACVPITASSAPNTV